MLEWIRIWNFKIHRKLFLRFDKYVTTIVGKTDGGKSTIIQALLWVFFDRPLGIDFLSWDKKECKVSVCIDGRVITRTKSKSINKYDIDGKVFKANKTVVPEEVQELLKVDEVNFQLQLDSPFWFMETAGQVSKELNRIIDLGVIDLSLSNINSTVREAKSEVTAYETRLASLTKQKQKEKWIQKADSRLQEIEKVSARVDETNAHIQGLTAHIDSIHTFRGCLKLAKKARKRAKEITVLGQQVTQDRDGVDTLKRIVDHIMRLEKVSKVRAPDFKPIASLSDQLNKEHDGFTELYGMVSSITNLKEALCHQRELATKAEKDLHKLMKNQPCPLCGTVMT